MFGVTAISCKIVKKINVDDDDDEEEEEQQQQQGEEKHAKKLFCQMNDIYFLRSISKGKKIVVSHGLQKNYRLNWPFLA